MSGMLQTSKNALMLFSGNTTRMVATFLFFWYAANALGVQRFGMYSLVVTYFELLTSLSAAAAGNLLIREIARAPQDRDRLFSSASLLVSGLAVLLPIVVLPLLMPFQYSQETMLGIAIACLGLIPAAISVLYEEAFVAHQRAEFVTIGIAVECLVRVAISILLIWLGYGIIALSVVMVLSRIILLIVYRQMMQSFVGNHWRYDRQSLISFLRQWRVFAVENWMFTISTNLDMIILSSMLGEVAVGLYSAAWRYVRLGATAAKSFTRAAFPMMARLHTESQETFERVFRQTVFFMCLVALPIIAVVAVIPDRVVALIFKPEYAESAPILQILIAVMLFEFLNPFLSFTLFSQGKQRCSMYVAAIGLICSPILLLVLISQMGAVGAAIATVTSGLIATSTYFSFILPPAALLRIVLSIFRIILAAAGLALAIHFAAEQPWWAIFLLSGLVYGALLFVVGAIPLKDLQTFMHHQRSRKAAI